MPRMCKAGRTEAGYTYVTVLVALVAMALAAQVTFVPTATELRREDEAELIFRGQEYARAIDSYYRADPARPIYPPTLDALLQDPRASERRFIRRLYDPLIGDQWDEIPAADGGIVGVSIRLARAPFRRGQLPRGVSVEESDDGGAIVVFSLAGGTGS